MKLHNQVKPLSYVKANAPKILQDLAETGNPMVITVNGEAVAILQDVRSYQETQDTMAMLKVLAMGEREVREGKISPARDAMARVRAKLKR
jgi:PHD/YefM family antitoxin component YafN of YafNO toxin-antitoxin module